jgi:type III secretory pathway component EscT
VFLARGGASDPARALLSATLPGDPVVRAAHDIHAGIQLAIALGAPMLAAAVVLEITLGLLARAANPISIRPLLAPLRSFAVVAVFAIVFERIAAAIARS